MPKTTPKPKSSRTARKFDPNVQLLRIISNLLQASRDINVTDKRIMADIAKRLKD